VNSNYSLLGLFVAVMWKITRIQHKSQLTRPQKRSHVNSIPNSMLSASNSDTIGGRVDLSVGESLEMVGSLVVEFSERAAS